MSYSILYDLWYLNWNSNEDHLQVSDNRAKLESASVDFTLLFLDLLLKKVIIITAYLVYNRDYYCREYLIQQLDRMIDSGISFGCPLLEIKDSIAGFVSRD